MLITVVLTLAISGFSFLLLGVKTFFVKGGEFPCAHVDGNKALHEKGIACAKSQDRLMRSQQNLYELINEKNNL
ncbi:MAG: hypothetical protein LBR34_07790 [Prevotella sp.]|jgi:hypothetical protein|nr:hypothetical protein [Prevotella sp.]